MQEVNVDGTVGPLKDLPTNTAKAMASIFGALQKPRVAHVKVTVQQRQADPIMFRCYLDNKHRRRRKKRRKSAKTSRRRNR